MAGKLFAHRTRNAQYARLDKPNAFAPRSRHAQQAAGELPSARSRLPRANRVIAVLIVLALVVAAVQVVLQGRASGSSLAALFSGSVNALGVYAIIYLAIVLLVVVGLLMVIYCDNTLQIHKARLIIRALIVELILGLLVYVIMNGVGWPCVFYLFQFICVISYQIYNDPNLARPPRFYNPFKEREKAVAEVYELDPERRGYIPLNFFNLFWIFMVASVIGLVFETLYCLLVNGVLKDRAGILWGPFSPIYGVGAVLMTVALNRWWYRNSSIIFVVAGVIGAAFEFFVSWYMETAFGVVAWDYSGTFLSLQGRTDFAHFCVWGFAGIIWMRLMLPSVMRIVDWMPLRWRACVTTIALVFMLVNGVMTLLALDCWSMRQAGYPMVTEIQQFFAESYDDDFMATRFASMDISEESAMRAQAAQTAG